MSAGKYAEMARKSASRGSKRFIYMENWDDRIYGMPYRQQRGTSDNIFRQWRSWRRFRWIIQDLRVFGLRETIRKNYYMQNVWTAKASERYLMGIDECGNKYWQSYDSRMMGSGTKFGRFIEPKDPHYLRGQDWNTPPPQWMAWLRGMIAHTPQQMKARGEFGPMGRIKDASPWKWYWEQWHVHQNTDDPSWIPHGGLLVSPWYKTQQEGGFQWQDWHGDFNANATFEQPHDLKQEVVENFYANFAHHRTNLQRGVDTSEL